MNYIKYMVSVNVITYNHEKYIAECLDSILAQKTKFDFEIVICDDCSKDATETILTDYQKKYPSVVRLRVRAKNVGLRHNYFDNIEACSGKYVAICEGDDFWTDSYKLQKQVDILEANPTYSMCFHSANELHQFDQEANRSNIFSSLEERTYSGQEILSNWLIPTASVMFRRDVSFKFDHLDKFLFYDIALFLRLCEYGELYCLNQVMSVYRRHSNSITNSNLSYKAYITHLKYLNAEFKGVYGKLIKRLIAIEYLKQAKYTYKQKSGSFINHTLTSVYYNVSPLYSMVKAKIKG